VLGGLIGLRDATPPPGAAGGAPAGSPGGTRRRHGSLRLKVRRLKGGRVRARVAGKGVKQVRRVTFRVRGKTLRVDRKRPFKATIARAKLRRHGRTRIAARIVRKDGTRAKRVRRIRARR
jgi:hypothetical protein